MRRLAALVLVIVVASSGTALAGISPYIRLAVDGNRLDMTDFNAGIHSDEAALQQAGYPANFSPVSPGVGLNGALGLWILPGFRIGAIYSREHARRDNRLHVPGQYFYDNDLNFYINEVGGEAILRIDRLMGLCLGGEVAQASVRGTLGYSEEWFGGQYYVDASASGRATTYRAFIGFDQTNSTGAAGFLHAGYRFASVGRLPSEGVVSDGSTSAAFTSQSVRFDYSGLYVSFGVGFDFGRGPRGHSDLSF
jgi:hypothetical protein